MEAFAANEYDVLVATTIIESGIDNPHSNTLVIEDSQRLGLAQLYQLKGRVGRSHIKAYAYFLFPAHQSLTEQATERLTAIGENTELGSGIKIAMRDLEIRGAGSLARRRAVRQPLGRRLRPVRADADGGRQRGARRTGRRSPRRARRPAGSGVLARGVRGRGRRARAHLPAPGRIALDRGGRRGLRRDGRSLRPGSGACARIWSTSPASGRWRPRPKPPTSASRAGASTISPLSLSDAKRGELTARGAVWIERERKLAMPLDYGESVTAAALGMLDAILS